MRNAGKAVRDAYFNALNGNISYGGENVPVYRNESYNTLPKHYIEITNIDEVNDPNDAKFIRDVILTLEVVSTQYRYRNYDVVDEISEDVTQLILSNIGGNLQSQYFQIGHIQVESARYLNEDNGEKLISRKILQFTQTLIQY